MNTCKKKKKKSNLSFMKGFLTGTIQDLMASHIFLDLSCGETAIDLQKNIMPHVKILEHISSSNISKFLVKIWSGLKE